MALVREVDAYYSNDESSICQSDDRFRSPYLVVVSRVGFVDYEGSFSSQVLSIGQLLVDARLPFRGCDENITDFLMLFAYYLELVWHY